jgi:hypothetical protein
VRGGNIPGALQASRTRIRPQLDFFSKSPKGLPRNMKSDLPLKQMLVIAVVAIIAYFAVFAFIENRRNRNGPWSVTFAADASGVPTLTVNEPGLKISNLRINFPGQSIPITNTALSFQPPKPVPFDLPFGRCIFEDTTFQPGTVVMELFGHEIQLMPRVLTIDKKEITWQSDFTISITATNSR